MLSLIILFPALAAFLGCFIEERSIKIYGICVAFIEFLLTLVLLYIFDENVSTMQFISQIWLIKAYGVSYLVGVDGISLFLVILSSFMTLIVLFALNIKENLKHLIISVLFLEMTMIGVFLALDLILFYVFWELSLLPMLYIIGAWGSGKRIYAAVKFFIYTFSGSVFLLVGIIVLGYLNFRNSGIWSFALIDLQSFVLPFNFQIWLFFAFFIAFAIKVPCFPFHTWLPYAHGQAPTIGSVLLASVLLKMGTYGFVRFSLPLFPDASIWAVDWVLILAIVMVIYAAMVALVQDDMKQVIAYSSISHMGIIMLGIFAINIIGISGSIFLMISHGIVSGMLFLLVGVIYERRHTKQISEFGGLANVMPKYAFVFAIAMFGSVGLPLTIGFVGEFLSLLGIFKVSLIYALLGGIGIIVGAIYMLNLFRNVFLGKCLNERNLALKDLSVSEILVFIPLCILIIYLGINPNSILKPIDLSVKQTLQIMQDRAVMRENLEFIQNANGGKK